MFVGNFTLSLLQMRIHSVLILLLLTNFAYAQMASLPSNVHLEHPVEKVKPLTKNVQILVKDIKSKEQIPFFTIDFTSCGHPVYESNADGLFSMETIEGFECYVRIAKRGYSNLDLKVDYDEIPISGKTYNIYLSKSPNSFNGHVRDTSGGNLYLADARIELTSLQNQFTQRVESNRQGEFSVYLAPRTDYRLRVQHPDYHPYERTFTTGNELDGHEINRLFVNRIGSKKIAPRLGSEVSVVRKDRKLEGINYYSVQILAKLSDQIDLDAFKDLETYGEVFIEEQGLISKVKVGKFFDRQVAEKMLSMIRSKTNYKDAFLTQYLAGNKHHERQEKEIHTKEEGYMVRLASYLNPELFDGSKVESLGEITSVQKNEWTIMLLSGFDRLDDAKRVVVAVRELGFRSAHVVQYEGSILVNVN